MAFEPVEGDFITETLIHDTRTWKVVRRTAQTITIVACGNGGVVKSENRDGNPYPCTWHEAVPYTQGEASKPRTLRRRKDGTYRVASWANPMRPVKTINGVPVHFTDYRE